MKLHILFCQISLIFVQESRSQYDYGYQAAYHQNHAQIINNQVDYKTYRRNIDSSCRSSSSSGDYDNDRKVECKCSCNECNKPKPGCKEDCLKCSQNANKGNDGIPYNLNQLLYTTQPQSNVMVVPYAVPVLIFPIKTSESPQYTKELNIKQNIEQTDIANSSSEYNDYPSEIFNGTKCKTVAKCYSRLWTKEKIVKHNIIKSTVKPILHLRPTIPKPSNVNQGLNLRKFIAGRHKYSLRVLDDQFAKNLMKDLKNKQLLLVENNMEPKEK